MIYTTYIDVSGHHAGSPVMVMGGYVGRLGQWANFDQKFGQLLKKNGLTYHHTKKLIHRGGEYTGWDDPKINRYVDKVQKLIDKNSVCGFAISVKENDFEEFYANGERVKGVTLDNKYGVCFRLFLIHISNMFKISLKGVEMHILRENGDPGTGGADSVFASFKKFAPPELRDMVKTVGLAEKKDYYGLQIADWVAFGAYQAEQGTPDLTYYQHGNTLQGASALVPYKSPVFRWEMTPAVLKDMKQRLIDHADQRREYWHREK